MLGITSIVLVVVVLGLAFLAFESSERPTLQRRGPWLVGAAAFILATLIISTYDDGIRSLVHPVRKHQGRELLVTACVMALLASEAVFISRWAAANLLARTKTSYLAVFTCTTLFAWFVTAMVFWAVVPGS